ncbi:hypothetical protein ACVILE_002783 [Streptomyces sp. M18.1]
MKTSVRMPVGAGLAALLLAAGAVGCSKEDKAEESPEMTPAAAVAEAAKNTEEIDSLHYRLTGRAPEEGRVEAEARMRMKPTLAMSMKMTALDQGPDAQAEIRIVDKAMYIGGGAEAAKEMDGKSWLKFDLAAMGAGDELNQLGGASQADKNPATESTFLTGAEDVEKVGTETVEGVETTHYKGTVFPRRPGEVPRGRGQGHPGQAPEEHRAVRADGRRQAHDGHVGRRRRPDQAVPDAR